MSVCSLMDCRSLAKLRILNCHSEPHERSVANVDYCHSERIKNQGV